MNTILLTVVACLVALFYWMSLTPTPKGTCDKCKKYPSECSCLTDNRDPFTGERTSAPVDNDDDGE